MAAVVDIFYQTFGTSLRLHADLALAAGATEETSATCSAASPSSGSPEPGRPRRRSSPAVPLVDLASCTRDVRLVRGPTPAPSVAQGLAAKAAGGVLEAVEPVWNWGVTR